MTKCDSVQLPLPTIKFNNVEIKGKHSIKLLGIIHDEKLTCKNIEVIENKICKTIAVLYRDNYLLDFRNLPKF